MSVSEEEFQRRLEQAKLEAMKELAYGASHEINNPLANISARAQTLLRDERDPDRRRALEAINLQALCAHEMISDLMLFARPPRLERRPTDVVAIIRDVLAEVVSECDRRGIEVAFASDGDIPDVSGDAVQLSVAVKAVLTNSIEAIGEGGRVDVRIVERSHGRNAGQVIARGIQLSVRDNGPGISPDVRPLIFDPFYSGREAGRGLGFGLSKAWRIVTEHGGRLCLAPSDGAGAEFVIELPAGVEKLD